MLHGKSCDARTVLSVWSRPSRSWGSQLPWQTLDGPLRLHGSLKRLKASHAHGKACLI